MSILSKIFGEGISKPIEVIGDIIDRTNTSDEEKLQLKNEAAAQLHGFWDILIVRLREFEQELTARHKSDMGSDSWLSKNIRPLTLAFLTVMTVVLAWATIFHLPETKVALLKPWIELLTALDLTAFGFYFGSRGIEKAVQMIGNALSKTKQSSV
ncbi:hypothetical protein [Prosthecochloris sp.]|uniref:hypothetical protein n=1 Tax=Prosthecochloris sp. TaxID=290513 RepID=UPI00257E41D0|nr:hypothetical protein [Prosthecochloris sp.]